VTSTVSSPSSPTLTDDRVVLAAASYLTMRSEGELQLRVVRRALQRMNAGGVIELVERRRGHSRWRIPVLTADELEALERRLRVYGKRAANFREAANVGQSYADAAYEWLTDAEKIASWTA
jgi:hypothetical protein